jgi:predicted lipoprotein with Yx(FWY)xxD motif
MPKRSQRTRMVLLAAVTLAAVAGVAASTAAASTGRAQAATVATHPSRYGKILFDGRGRALYLFGRDHTSRSTCSGACATAWPPFLTNGAPKAGPGIRASLLATTRRANGSLQVTYAGHPLYYYQGDSKPGQVKCQGANNFGGLWLVVNPTGKPIH